MKKILLLVFALFIVFAATGCEDSKDTSTEAKNDNDVVEDTSSSGVVQAPTLVE